VKPETTPAPATDRKIVLPRSELKARVEELRRRGLRIVFTNGCFDLLHPGHVRYLQAARSRGDILIVAVNSDESVRRLKGPSRPVLNESERCEILAALGCVDLVTVFTEDTPLEIISDLLPDELVKGGDWSPDRIVGREVVEAHGGRVTAIRFEPGYSTSAIIERILSLHARKP
jgi:rfaE bifunctional protein nucleotidyltransferase chain/domain